MKLDSSASDIVAAGAQWTPAARRSMGLIRSRESGAAYAGPAFLVLLVPPGLVALSGRRVARDVHRHQADQLTARPDLAEEMRFGFARKRVEP